MLKDLKGDGNALFPKIDVIELVGSNQKEKNPECVNMLVVVTSPTSFNINAPEVVTL